MASKKAEKRIAKKQEEEILRLEKKAAEVEHILAKRLPNQTVDPRPSKVPVEYKEGSSRLPYQAIIDQTTADREGQWTWGQRRDWNPEPGDDYIEKLINDWCRKTWRDIEEATVKAGGERRHVAYPLDAICPEAQARLVVLKKDDRDEIFRFRTMGKERLYGFRVGITFEVIWYDPHHKIYPVGGSNFTAPSA